MRIPIPPMPRWLDRALDWANVDVGAPITFQMRRIDYVGLAIATIIILADGAFFNGWTYALSIDPWVLAMGWMTVYWFR